MPKLGCIADDYTGATDLANSLTRQGTVAELIFGVPDQTLVAPSAEAVVVALKTRSGDPSSAIKQSVAVARWLRGAFGADQLYFKYCSTFDSTREGNIGPVAEALRDLAGSWTVPFCPSSPENGRTVYQRHLFVHGTPLSESPMRHHPLNPMEDSNVCRLLESQVATSVGHIPWEIVSEGAMSVRRELERLRGEGVTLVVIDALTDKDLAELGAAVHDVPLVTGAAGLANGIAAYHSRSGAIENVSVAVPTGRTMVLAGSCSMVTQQQVAKAREYLPSLPVDVFRSAEATMYDFGLWLRDHSSAPALMVYSTSDVVSVAEIQQHFGSPIKASQVVESRLAGMARIATGQGFTRYVVAGGETAGAVVPALGVKQGCVGPEVAPGVPWIVTNENPSRGVLLKSGNFGGEDFLLDAVQ